ncbi:MAG: PHP domain-containing protein [Armatimonadota bacterium]|nr:PHP domain-containing protein [Armatimonadota bacterium]
MVTTHHRGNRLTTYAADLHIHSVLSPCGDLSMSPRVILERACAAGLQLIALTDHNMAENGAALRALAAESGLALLFGMELETSEELHLLCLFDTYEAAMAWQEVVYRLLPNIPNDPDRFGDQVVVDSEENIVRFEKRLLANAADLPLAEACEGVTACGGLAIPAHVDRPVHSLISQLGFPPPGLQLPAVELSRFASPRLADQHPWLRNLPKVGFSDAHFPHEVGAQHTLLHVFEPTVAEIRLALRGEGGRWARRVVRAPAHERGDRPSGNTLTP